MISFEKIKSKMRLMNPQKDFLLEEIPFEVRYDPLTGLTGHVFDLPYKHPGGPSASDMVERSKAIFCPFCPETIGKYTPLFPKDVIPEGRIKIGKATLIPNILPLDKYVGVSILSDQHYMGIDELTPEVMKDSFLASQLFLKKVAGVDSQVNFFTVNWNYMPQAGSSLIHPHIQVTCGEVPTNHLRMQIEGCNRYFEENGSNFWEDYVETEKGIGERYIGEIGQTYWFVSFAPQSFLPDVWCIFLGHESLIDLGEDTLMDYLTGLSKILRYYSTEHIFSFNMSIFSVRENDQFRVNARILPRLLLREIGNSDHTYSQTIHKEPCSVRPPESVCPRIKEFFQK